MNHIAGFGILVDMTDLDTLDDICQNFRRQFFDGVSIYLLFSSFAIATLPSVLWCNKIKLANV